MAECKQTIYYGFSEPLFSLSSDSLFCSLINNELYLFLKLLIKFKQLKRYLLATVLSILTLSSVAFTQSKDTLCSSDFSFSYEQDGVKKVHFRGKVIDNADFLRFMGKNYSMILFKDDGVYVDVNGKLMGPYEYVSNKEVKNMTPVLMNEKGDYIFIYSKDKRRYVNVSGKILGPYPTVVTKSLTLNSKGDYGYTYLVSQKERFAVINGVKYGPLVNESDVSQGVSEDGINYYEYSDTSGNFYINIDNKSYLTDSVQIYGYHRLGAFVKMKGDKYYLFKRDSIIGPFDNLVILRFVQAGIIYKYLKDKKWYVNYLNKQTFGPYDEVNIEHFNWVNNDIFVFKYQNGGKYYYNISGKVYGPYEYVKRLIIKDNGEFAFAFEKNGWSNLNINGEVKGENMGIVDDLYFDNNVYAYSYRKDKKDTKSFYAINEKSFGPFIGIIERIYLTAKYQPISWVWGRFKYIITPSGNYGPFSEIKYLFVMPDGRYGVNVISKSGELVENYILIDGIKYGPFEEIKYFRFGVKSGFVFVCKIEGKYYIVNNKNLIGPFESLSSFYTTENWTDGTYLN